jgi:hypothetical protein
MPSLAEELASVRATIGSGQVKAELDELEKLRKAAKKARRAPDLFAVLEVSRDVEQTLDGRNKRTAHYITYAAEQNLRELKVDPRGTSESSVESPIPDPQVETPATATDSRVESPAADRDPLAETLAESREAPVAAEDVRPDIAAARQRMSTTFGGRKEIKRLVAHLWEGEQVDRMTTGWYGGATGILVLTDRRLLFVKEGAFSKKLEDFPLDKISSVQWRTGLVTGTVTIFASGNKAEIGNVSKGDGKDITDHVRHRISAPKPQVAASPAVDGAPQQSPPPSIDIPDQIRKLGELRELGMLTADEFEAKKAELLARM